METWIVSVIAPSVITILGGIGWFVKYKLEQVEKKRIKEIEERNIERDKIKSDLEDLKQDVNSYMSIILKCKNPDCPSKPELSEYFQNKINREKLS